MDFYLLSAHAASFFFHSNCIQHQDLLRMFMPGLSRKLKFEFREIDTLNSFTSPKNSLLKIEFV